MKPNNFRLFVLILTVGAFFVPIVAQAQISVDLKLNRSAFIAHEAISGKLTVVNRAGRDLILGNTNGASWLSYSIKDAKGQIVSPVRRAPNSPPVVIASGQTHTLKVIINEAYPMDQVGTYRIQAVVSFPQINQVFPSRSVAVQIAEAKPFWSQVIGVPDGQPGAGTYRVFELITYYHGSRSKALYFRMKTNNTGRVLACFSVGNYLGVRPPVFKIDRDNHLHILQLATPQQYYYTVVDFGGEVVVRESYFEKKGSHPALYKNNFGEVNIRGGATAEEMKTPYERREFRLLSERPPGLPKI